jgi:hypothetical protein
MNVNYIVGTATTKDYFFETQQMLYSLYTLLPNDVKVVICDNGLDEKQRNILKNNFGFCNIEIFEKKLSDYEKKNYLFKNIVLRKCLEMSNKDTIYMWLDAKTMLKYNEKQILEMLEVQPIYGHIVFNEPEYLWTDKRTLDLLKLDIHDRKTFQIQASAMLFDLRKKETKEFIDKFLDLCDTEEVIAPKGSSKGFTTPTHRQDQSVFSCCMKKMGYYIHNNKPWAIMHNTIHK